MSTFKIELTILTILGSSACKLAIKDIDFLKKHIHVNNIVEDRTKIENISEKLEKYFEIDYNHSFSPYVFNTLAFPIYILRGITEDNNDTNINTTKTIYLQYVIGLTEKEELAKRMNSYIKYMQMAYDLTNNKKSIEYNNLKKQLLNNILNNKTMEKLNDYIYGYVIDPSILGTKAKYTKFSAIFTDKINKVLTEGELNAID